MHYFPSIESVVLSKKKKNVFDETKYLCTQFELNFLESDIIHSTRDHFIKLQCSVFFFVVELCQTFIFSKELSIINIEMFGRKMTHGDSLWPHNELLLLYVRVCLF